MTSQAIVAVVKSPRAADEQHLPAAFAPAVESPQLNLSLHGVCVALDTGPPPDDLVVMLGRLVI